MGVSDEFVDYVVEQLAGWGAVSVRRMFGGAGLYREGTMFAVLAGVLEDPAELARRAQRSWLVARKKGSEKQHTGG